MKMDDELRIAIEWGPRHNFFENRRNRIVLYGNVLWFEFTDAKIANIDSRTKNLDQPDWLCSLTKFDYDVFDRTNFTSKLSMAHAGVDNFIDEENGIAKVKFWRPMSAVKAYRQTIDMDIP